MSRKRWVLLLAIGLLVAAVVIAYSAQQAPRAESGGSCPMTTGLGKNVGHPHGAMAQGAMHEGTAEGAAGQRMMANCPWHGGMARSGITAQGKYIYVLAGNRLMKYTLDLKPVAETPLKIGPPAGQTAGAACPMTESCPTGASCSEQTGATAAPEQQH